MSIQYTMPDAKITLPGSDYTDASVNFFSNNGSENHSFVVTRGTLPSTSLLVDELNNSLKHLVKIGATNFSEIVKSEMPISINNKVGTSGHTTAILADYSFDIQGKTQYQQQLVAELPLPTDTFPLDGVKNYITFTYTQPDPIGFGEDSDRLLEVWNSIVLNDI